LSTSSSFAPLASFVVRLLSSESGGNTTKGAKEEEEKRKNGAGLEPGVPG